MLPSKLKTSSSDTSTGLITGNVNVMDTLLFDKGSGGRTITVTVNSSNKFVINGSEQPFLILIPGIVYKLTKPFLKFSAAINIWRIITKKN